VSLTSQGGQATGHSEAPSVSADGRFVAFSSVAGLVPGDTNGISDIFVRDRTLGTTTRASVDSSGAEANGGSRDPAMSANGRFVAFDSLASNLVPGDTNDQFDVFVHDLQTGTTVRTSVDSQGNESIDHCSVNSMSANGRFRLSSSFCGSREGRVEDDA
jgi:Tol biopolymer transport system component